MLFDFFKKHKRQNVVQQHLGDFQNSFSEKQKEAILASLFIIANSDKEYHNKENEFFKLTATILGYNLNMLKNTEKILKLKLIDLMGLLHQLNEIQKEWFIITAYGMVNADGQALDIEYNVLLCFAKGMGVSEAIVKDILTNSELLQ